VRWIARDLCPDPLCGLVSRAIVHEDHLKGFDSPRSELATKLVGEQRDIVLLVVGGDHDRELGRPLRHLA